MPRAIKISLTLVPCVFVGLLVAADGLLNKIGWELPEDDTSSVKVTMGINLDTEQAAKRLPTTPLTHESARSTTSTNEETARQTAGIQKLPGVFRGDWGETPVYAKDDRVNYERGVYLSLVDGNQNQPPSTSFGYWRHLGDFKAIREENCLSPAPNQDMGECDFTAGENLKDRDLRGAILRKARLNGELGNADLTGADLSAAMVIGKLVIGPDTRLEKANFSKLQSDGNNPLIAESANLSQTNFTQANLYGAKMVNADLSGAVMAEATLTGSQLSSATLNKANLVKADLSYANLSDSLLVEANLVAANFEQADLSHADLSQANLRQTNLAGSNLSGANFSGADVRGVNFAAAQNAETAIIDDDTDFTSAVCPDGVTVDGQITTCVGHGF